MQSSYHVTPRCSVPESVSPRPRQKAKSPWGQPGGGCQASAATCSKGLRASCWGAQCGTLTGLGT
eukprot:6086392-Alexandrium_andersonii.AAC.1